MSEERFALDLDAWRRGDQGAGDRLYASAYDELKNVASRALRSLGRGDQLQTTALVHECYLKLVASGSIGAESRNHFLALCARAMRQIIVDSARRQLAEKRGGAGVARDPGRIRWRCRDARDARSGSNRHAGPDLE